MGTPFPSTRPTPGLFVAHGPRVWSASGDVLIAYCNSPHLCVAGNEANARLLAEAPAAVALVRRFLESAQTNPTSTPDGQCFVDALQLIARLEGRHMFPAFPSAGG